MRVPDVRGTKILTGEIPPPTFGKGRICQHDDCDIVLNHYNPDLFCGLHRGEEYEIECDECGTLLPFTNQFFWATRHRLLHTCKECQGFKIRHLKLSTAREV